jgi:hypothetical protein
MFIVLGPSNFTVVTPSGISTKLVYQGDKPQSIVPATKNSSRLENEAVTSEGRGSEDGTKSDATDPNTDDSIVILGSGNKTEHKITQDSVINTDAISEGIGCTTPGINGLQSNETAGENSLPMARFGDMNAGTLGYLVSGDRVKRTPFEEPFGFRETVNTTIRDKLNLTGTTTGGATGVSTNPIKRARRSTPTTVPPTNRKRNWRTGRCGTAAKKLPAFAYVPSSAITIVLILLSLTLFISSIAAKSDRTTNNQPTLT